MIITSEGINHDRQNKRVEGPVSTTSQVFEPVPGISITTKDLGSKGDYIAFLSMTLQHSQNNSTVTFRATVGAAVGQDRVVTFGPNAANDPRGRTFISEGGDVGANEFVFLEWKTSGGTATIDGARFVIDGVPEIRVIQ